MMNEIRRLALFHVIACLCSALNGNRAVFEEQPYGDIIFKQDGTMPNLFHKRFHQCSIDKECNYVVHYINTNEYRKIGKQSQLPIHRKGCKIWKKMTVEVQLEGRAKDLKSSDVSASSSKRTSARTSLKASYASSSRTTTNNVDIKTLESNTAPRESIALSGSTTTGAGVKLSMTLSLSFKSTKSFDVSGSSAAVLRSKSKQFSTSVIHLATSSELSKIARIDNNISSSRTSEMQLKIGLSLSLLTNAVGPTPPSTAKIADISKHNNVFSTYALKSPTAVPEKNTVSVLVQEPLTLGRSHTWSSLKASLRPTPLSSAKIADMSNHNNVASTNVLGSTAAVPEKNIASALVKEPLTPGVSHPGSSSSNSIRPTPLPTVKKADITTYNAVSTSLLGSPTPVSEKKSNSIISSTLVKKASSATVGPGGSLVSNSMQPSPSSRAKTADISKHKSTASKNTLSSPMTIPETNSNSITSSVSVKETLTLTESSVSNPIRPTPLSTEKTEDITTHSDAASINVLRSKTAVLETNSNSITSSAPAKQASTLEVDLSGSSLSNLVHHPVSTIRSSDINTRSNVASTNILTSPLAVPETNSNSITSSASGTAVSVLGVEPTGSSFNNPIQSFPVSKLKSADISRYNNTALANALSRRTVVVETRNNSIAYSGALKEASVYGVSPTGALSSNSIRLTSLSPGKGADLSSGKIVRSASIITSTPATADISGNSLSPSKSATVTASARVDSASSSSSNVIAPTPTTVFAKASSVMSKSTMSMQTPLFSSRNEELSVSRSTSAMLLHASKHPSKATGMSVPSTESNTPESGFTISFAASRSIGVSGLISSSSDQISKTASFGLITIDQTNSILSITASQLTIPTSSSSDVIPTHSFKSQDIAGASAVLQGHSSVLASLSTDTEKLMISKIRSGVVETTPTSASISISAFSSRNDARILQPSSSLLVASFSIATKILAASEMPNAMTEATATQQSISPSVKRV